MSARKAFEWTNGDAETRRYEEMTKLSLGKLTPLLLNGRVHDLLRERILSGQIKPGDRLTLSGLANEFGVSSTPVRDALRELAKERLVDERPMSGYRVAQPDVEALIAVWNLREAVECQAARLCAKNATDANLAELEQLAEEADEALREEVHARPYLNEKEVRFHRRVVEISGCPELMSTFDRTLAMLKAFADFKATGGAQEDIPLHMEVVRQIALRDPDRAERAMRAQVALRMGDLERRATMTVEAP